MIQITALGIGTSVQDLGRPGLAHVGVGVSGAADRTAHALANRLVGNDPTCATIESSGGVRFTVVAAVEVAVTGAWCSMEVLDGPALGLASPLHLPAGARVSFGALRAGLRAYVALRGGVATPVVLGSRSRDSLGRLGHELSVGELVDVGGDPGTPMVADVAPQREWPTNIVVAPGPRRDWFAPDAMALLARQRYLVASSSNRVGLRLRGEQPLRRATARELPSEGLVLGAVQVPHDGQPIVMLADHPITGGYPVIAVVADESLSTIAQAVPGTSITFTLRS